MSIRSVVPDIKSDRLDESRDFSVGLLGFELAMDMGWIVTFASPTNPTAQISSCATINRHRYRISR